MAGAPAGGRVPELRVRALNDAPVRADGAYVLYWMTAARRPAWNFALDRAVAYARELGKPLWVLEALRCDYPFASHRLHAFVLQGMADNARAFAASPVGYHPYVEPTPGAGRGLLAALAAQACVAIADEWPSGFHPRMLAAAAAQCPVRLEAVDGNGLLPLRAADRAYPTARGFRSLLRRVLPPHLDARPAPMPPGRGDLPPAPPLPSGIATRWPAASDALLAAAPAALAGLPIDPAVPPVPAQGGRRAGRAVLDRFMAEGLPRYATDARHPDAEATSGLSPWLHFGHISVHEVLAAVQATAAPGEGWWGLGPDAEAFLDQLVTWRELGFNGAARGSDPMDYASLPAWARRTLAEQAPVAREYVYPLEELEAARTHDALWNAAQAQLRREGHIHNYLRMLWGKKVLEWSATPQAAWAALLHLNDRWALDGRDPNSYSGIGWIFGRYDRAWGPRRPVFGTVRYMSSASTARKLRLKRYLARYGSGA